MKTILLTLISIISLNAGAKIIELQSMNDLQVATWNEKTLVVFDIDNTLLRQDSMIGTHQWGDYMKERAMRAGLSENEAKQYQYRVFGQLQDKLNVVPVEVEVLGLLKTLEDKNIKHFALTARSAILKDVTAKQVETLKHNFSKKFPLQKDLTKIEKHLHQGIIFSGDVPKGELLKTIVENSPNEFDHIVFVDDKLYNLESIEKSFTNNPIKLESFRYSAADVFVNNFNPVIADLQYSFILESKHLVTQDELASRSSVLDLAGLRLDFYLNTKGPLVKATNDCMQVKELSVICSYLYDGTAASVEFSFSADAHTGGLFFGTW
jgi:FMN phosphatase YigB (HAD superfamily)